MTQPMIGPFSGKYRFLSNFYPSPLQWRGHTWNTVEHAYQASKTDDPAEREKVRQADTPGRAKRLGQKVRMRPSFEQEKFAVMEEIVDAKFTQNPELRDALLATGDRYLCEFNAWSDILWGVCNGIGENHLGKTLMRVRDRLRTE